MATVGGPFPFPDPFPGSQKVVVHKPDVIQPQFIPLIRAALDGKVIQQRQGNGTYEDLEQGAAIRLLTLDYLPYQYRVKPNPHVRYMAVVVSTGDIGPARASNALACEAFTSLGYRKHQFRVLRMEYVPGGSTISHWEEPDVKS